MPVRVQYILDFSGSKRTLFEVFIIRLHGCRLPERLRRQAGVAEALEFGQLDVQAPTLGSPA